MDGIKAAMNRPMRSWFGQVNKRCPRCDTELINVKPEVAGRIVNGAACPRPGCGYMEIEGKTYTPKQKEIQELANRKTAIAYMGQFSVMATALPQTARFSNFTVGDERQKQMLEFAKKTSLAMLDDPIHVIFPGRTGTGKTHIASAMMRQYLELSHYTKKVIFLDTRGYLTAIKRSYSSDYDTREMFTLQRNLKLADLVVLDDLGAERKTDDNTDKLSDIITNREDKNLIITTNLTGKEIRANYGERIVSRMMKHSKDYVFKTDKMSDYRRHS